MSIVDYDSVSTVPFNERLELHYPCIVDRNDKGRKKLRRCQLCALTGRGRKRTHVYCAACPGKPGLCQSTCFEEYHNQL